jgi:hypothetical protein
MAHLLTILLQEAMQCFAQTTGGTLSLLTSIWQKGLITLIQRERRLW